MSNEFSPSGLRVNKDIYLPESSPENFLMRYFHEVGHVLSEKLSFDDGEVLTVDECKYGIASLPSDLLALTFRYLYTPNLPYSLQATKNVADMIISFFSKGHFNPDLLNLHTNVPPEEIYQLVLNANGSLGTSAIDEDGNLTYVSTNFGRDIEIPAIFCERGCLRILENTLNRYLAPHREIRFSFVFPNDGSSHWRAHKFVERAFSRRGWRIPSALDLDLLSSIEGIKPKN